jgi:Flp pilus assembly pilin Flp
MIMRALLLRMLKDESGNGMLGQVLLISGVSLTIIPASRDIGAKLVAVFSKISNALH